MPKVARTIPKDPRAIATAAAEEYIAAIASNSDLGDVFEGSPLDDAMDEIGLLLVKEHGPITSDADVTYEILGRRTGYLVGVQVGMRLRGGAR
jgi:hypothetical protein